MDQKIRIGILSMQRVANYGSFLQAYALKSIFENQGCLCSFITPVRDHQIPGLKKNTRFFVERIFRRLIGWDICKRVYYEFIFRKKFNIFHRQLLEDVCDQRDYDLVVIGSDEVFNCTQRAPWCFSSQLFGKLPNAHRIISYAASFGHTTFQDLVRYDLAQLVGASLSYLAEISVRDGNSYALIKKITGRTPLLHVDPVLVYDFGDLIPENVPEQDYILIYSYPGRISAPREIEAIQNFARQKRKKLVSVGFYFPWCDRTVVPHPFEVLAYFKKATYVITDTFHGTVMSIKFNKQFCTIIRDTNTQKLSFLLEQFGLREREIKAPFTAIARLMDTEIDYISVNSLLQQEKARTIDYLRIYPSGNKH